MDDKTYWSAIAEAKVVLHYTQLGLDVFISNTGKSSCDLVVIDEWDQAFRVQVKCCRYRNKRGNWQAELKSCRHNKTQNKIIYFDGSKSDILAIYLPEEDRLEFFDSMDYDGKAQLIIKSGRVAESGLMQQS